MDFVDEIPVCLLHVLEADIAKDTGVVDENIDAAEGVNGCLDDGLSILYRVVIGDRLAASGADRLDNFVCGLCTGLAVETCRVAGSTLTAEPAPSPLKLLPRSLTTTFAPRLPKKMAYSRPRPPPAPVTTTVWPSYRSSCAAMVDAKASQR